jgi:DNA repair photolyase
MHPKQFTWDKPATIQPNNFKFKSLSSWSFNTAVGCAHACRFCYVPEVSTTRGSIASKLATYGVLDPDAEWGAYAGVRRWHEGAFLASLKRAENTPADRLNPDGNRAVMFCTTTDPYQVLRGELGEHHATMVSRALELIRDHSTLNVRILTRSPLAKKDFDLMRSFGSRLMFGMSLPTLNDRLARIYEPNAPSPTQRLKCLRAAHEAGLNIYVAVAPTYPECGAQDMIETLQAIKPLNPMTVFMEPVNIRAENVKRIAEHARKLGERINTNVFATPVEWRRYAMMALSDMEIAAADVGMFDRLHLWPDASLGNKTAISQAVADLAEFGLSVETQTKWLNGWWNRISEWPKQKNT